MVILGGGAVSYGRGTSVLLQVKSRVKFNRTIMEYGRLQKQVDAETRVPVRSGGKLRGGGQKSGCMRVVGNYRICSRRLAQVFVSLLRFNHGRLAPFISTPLVSVFPI